jgi:hypothetical protein
MSKLAAECRAPDDHPNASAHGGATSPPGPGAPHGAPYTMEGRPTRAGCGEHPGEPTTGEHPERLPRGERRRHALTAGDERHACGGPEAFRFVSPASRRPRRRGPRDDRDAGDGTVRRARTCRAGSQPARRPRTRPRTGRPVPGRGSVHSPGPRGIVLSRPLAAGAVARGLRRGDVGFDAAISVVAEVAGDESPPARRVGERLGLRCQARWAPARVTATTAVLPLRVVSLML